jgi:beta-N-acetylglucosaminidase
MSKIKKILSVSIILIFILPQVPVKAISNEINTIVNKYEKITVANRERFSSNTDGAATLVESEDVIANREDKETYELLVPKTDANYEVALSYEDGSYVYVDNADTYDEAVALAQEEVSQVRSLMSSEIIIPTVIDFYGNVIYATEAIGRVWKSYNDGIKTGRDKLCYVYSDSTMTNAYTYIHENYISEVPLIQDAEKEAKVLVAGYEGWMNKDITRDIAKIGYNNEDLRIYPITAVTNPSYYYVENSILKHCISSSMDGTSKTIRTIGIAPSYLKSGVEYFSYDGNYFYAGSKSAPATGLRALTKDLQSGNHNQAVNASDPYYNYYNYLPFRTKTNYTAEEIDFFINKNTNEISKLRGLGQAFIDNQNKYGVNALLALGVAINESSYTLGWGTSDYALLRNNLFGLNATDNDTDANTSYYSSPEACVEEFCKNWISKGYANPDDSRSYGGFLGNKRLGANVKYASDPYWSEKAVSFAFQADYELSGNDITKMKDYNYYQLIKYTSASTVKNASGQALYPVNSVSVTGDGAPIGGVTAMVASNVVNVAGTNSYEVYGERTTAMDGTAFVGAYDWKIKAYVNSTSVVYINEGKTKKEKEDIDLDGDIDITDLAILGQTYNKLETDKVWKDRQDINNDGIIDIYDIVRLSKKL